MIKQSLITEQIRQYHEDGYVVLKGFFTAEEVSRLYDTAIADVAVSKHAINVNDSTGKRKMALIS